MVFDTYQRMTSYGTSWDRPCHIAYIINYTIDFFYQCFYDTAACGSTCYVWIKMHTRVCDQLTTGPD